MTNPSRSCRTALDVPGHARNQPAASRPAASFIRSERRTTRRAVTQMRCETAMLSHVIRQRRGRAVSAESGADAGSGGNRRLAPPGQWRRTHLERARAECEGLRRQHRLPLAGWFSEPAGADLPGLAPSAAEPLEDCAPHRAGQAGRNPYRHRRTHRPDGEGLLPTTRPVVHDELHDAISGIYFSARTHP